MNLLKCIATAIEECQACGKACDWLGVVACIFLTIDQGRNGRPFNSFSPDDDDLFFLASRPLPIPSFLYLPFPQIAAVTFLSHPTTHNSPVSTTPTPSKWPFHTSTSCTSRTAGLILMLRLSKAESPRWRSSNPGIHVCSFRCLPPGSILTSCRRSVHLSQGWRYCRLVAASPYRLEPFLLEHKTN